MSFTAWVTFSAFWIVFVTSPGPNALNCITNGMTYGFKRSLWGVAAILVQATLFLTLAAAGLSAAYAIDPVFLLVFKALGAIILILMGIRTIKTATKPTAAPQARSSIFWPALLIATFNVKSLLGYLAAFGQFISADLPLGPQITLIIPTALTLTALSYTGWTALGAYLGHKALDRAIGTKARSLAGLIFVVLGSWLLISLRTPPVSL